MIGLLQATTNRFQTLRTEMWRDGKGRILLAVSAGWFLSFGVRLIFPALLPTVREVFAMNLTVSGFLISALWFAYAIGQLPSGIIRDRIGDRKVLTLSTTVTAFTILVVSASTSVVLLFGATILFALSTALYGPSRYTVLTETFPKHNGLAVGITLSAGNVGNALLPAIAGVLAAAASWRLGFGFAVPLFAASALLLWRAIPASAGVTDTQDEEVSLAAIRGLFDSIGSRPVLVTTGIQILAGFTWQGFAGFYVTYLVAIKDITPEIATFLFSSFFLVGVGVQIAAGAAVDRFGSRLSLMAVIGVLAPALFALPFAQGVLPLVAITIFMSSMLGIRPIANTYLVGILPEEQRGGSFGLLRTIFIMAASTGPITVGILADLGHFHEAFLLLGGTAFLAFLLSTRLPERP